MSYLKANTRYNSIRDRAFKSYFDIFLIKCFLEESNLSNVNITEFESFHYDDSDFESCLKVYQLSSEKAKLENGLTVKALDSAIDDWMNRSDTKPFKDYFIENRLIDKEAFKAWYGDDTKDRSCEWCGIMKTEIEELIKAGQIHTKRLSTRGRDMEVDRRAPNKGYEDGNLALCCYWCNNAKTDEFSEEEFLPVGEAIKEIFRKRLTEAREK
jgi:hypothetical protein